MSVAANVFSSPALNIKESFFYNNKHCGFLYEKP